MQTEPSARLEEIHVFGFVIYFTLERSATWKDFAFSRVTRLYPADWTALTLVVVLDRVLSGSGSGSAATSST